MSEVHEFLTALYGGVEQGVFTLFSLPSGKSLFFDMSPDMVWAELLTKKLATMGSSDLYFGVCPLERKPVSGRGASGDVGVMPGLWLDVDVSGAGHKSDRLPPTLDAAMALIYAFPLAPSLVINSGGGLHAYWLFNEPMMIDSEPSRARAQQISEGFQGYMSGLAAAKGWDLDATHDLSRVLRIPGTKNHKYRGSPAVGVIESNDYYRYEPRDFDDYRGSHTPRQPDHETGTKLSKSGGRNNALKAIVAACLGRMEGLEQAVYEVLKYDAKHHDTPLFTDPDEFRGVGDAYSNALEFVSNITNSINKRRARQGEPAQRFGFEKHDKPAEVGPGSIKVHSFGDIYTDTTPIPDDLIEGIISPGDFILIAGPPKSQKSLLAQDMMVSAALGRPLMGRFKAPKPLTSMFINMEMKHLTLRKRIPKVKLTAGELAKVYDKIQITEPLPFTLDDKGAEAIYELIVRTFPDDPPDLMFFDPMVNLFSGASENDNAEMMAFLRRLGDIRRRINPDAGLILVHHTAKMKRGDMSEDPFNSIRGASALRGHYSGAILIMRQSESSTYRKMFFDGRDGAPPEMLVDYKRDEGKFVEVSNERITGKVQGSKHDRESDRKNGVIFETLFDKAYNEGALFTSSRFAEFISRQDGMGSASTIKERLSELLTKGDLALTKGGGLESLEHLILPPKNSDGFLVSKGMKIRDFNPETGELSESVEVTPTHKKDAGTGKTIAFDFWGESGNPE